MTTTNMPTLADRIVEAERELTPLKLAVNRLEASRTSAVEAGDFTAAQVAQDALPRAREEAAAGQALVDSLRAASGEIARQQADDAAALQLAERTAEARQALGAHQKAENDHLAEASHQMQRARDLAREAREAVLSALAAERLAGQEREAVEQCLSLIEQRPAFRKAGPRSVEAATGQDQLIIAILRHAK